jgi:hypothetical protein
MSGSFGAETPERAYSANELSSMHLLRRMYALDIWRVILTYSVDSPEVFLTGQIIEQVKERSPGSLVSRLAVEAEVDGFIGEGMVRRIMPPPRHLPRNAVVYERVESPKWAGVVGFVEAIPDVQITPADPVN